MKKHSTRLLLLLAFAIFGQISHLSAQQAQWKLPVIDVPLISENDTLGLLQVDSQYNFANLEYKEESYRINFNHNFNRCEILKSDSLFANGKRLNRNLWIHFTFVDNQFINLKRKNRRRNAYEIRMGKETLVKFPGAQIGSLHGDDRRTLLQAVFIVKDMRMRNRIENTDNYILIY